MTCTNTTIITRHTSVWHGTKFDVFSLSGYRYLGDGGTDRREILHDDPRQVFYHKSEIFGLTFDHLTSNITKTVNRSVTCQLELNINSTRAF